MGKNGMALNRSTKRIKRSIHPAAKVPGDATDDDADEHLDEDNHKPNQQRDAPTVHEASSLHPFHCCLDPEGALLKLLQMS